MGFVGSVLQEVYASVQIISHVEVECLGIFWHWNHQNLY